MSRVNIDQRPLWLSVVGGLTLVLSLSLGLRSLGDDALQLYRAVRATNGPRMTNLFTYSTACSRQPPCRLAYWRAWQAGPLDRSLLGSGLLLGALFLGVGSTWRPEVSIQRARRMRSWREFDVPGRSACVPVLQRRIPDLGSTVRRTTATAQRLPGGTRP